jgi:hypothetical protein
LLQIYVKASLGRHYTPKTLHPSNLTPPCGIRTAVPSVPEADAMALRFKKISLWPMALPFYSFVIKASNIKAFVHNMIVVFP